MITDAEFELLKVQFSQLQGMVGPMAQMVHQHEVYLQPVKNSPILTHRDGEMLYGPAAMRGQLGAGGAAPLSLQGLKGATAEAQAATIPQVPQLPQLGDPAVKVGTVLNVSGENFRRGAVGWEPLAMSTAVVPATPAASGGGGGSSSGFVNPMTTLGDTLYEGASAAARLPGVTSLTKQFLTQTGTGSVSAIPVWSFLDYTNLFALGQSGSMGPANIQLGGAVLAAGSYGIFYNMAPVPTGAVTLAGMFIYTDPRLGVQGLTFGFSGSSGSLVYGVYPVTLDGLANLTVTVVQGGVGTVVYDLRVNVVRFA